MKAKRISRLLFTACILALLIGIFAGIGARKEKTVEENEPLGTRLLSDSNGSTVDIVNGTVTNYIIVFAANDGRTDDNNVANELYKTISDTLNVKVRPRADSSTPESAHEILVGNTNRALSKELMTKINSSSENENLVWGVLEKDGKIAFSANCPEAFERGKSDLFKYLTEDNFSVPVGTDEINTLTRSEYDAELKAEQDRIEAEKEAERLKRIEELKALIGEFEYSEFGDAPTTSMAGNSYGKPAVYPNTGEHPRVNVTSYMLPDIIAYMESAEAKYTTAEFWRMANTEYDGKLPPAREHTSGRIGFHNMDEKALGIIEAKAFAYLITGNELYGYEAIYAMKNFLVTIDIQHIHSDQCREFGRIMYGTAEVYDWCYDLLTEDDKAQFIMACADIGSSKNQNTDFGNQMEVGFPPKLQGCVSGHGSEHQVLRDYLSISIAIFDEDPTWYTWVGGLVYNYFVPFRDVYFTSGTYPQGMNCYAPHRFDADLWSAWLLLCATGEIPYSDDFARVARSFFQNETPNGSFFSTGDGDRQKNGSAFWHHAVISSALYGDMPLRSAAFKFTGGFSGYTANTLSFSYAHMLILSASYHSKTDQSKDPVDRFSESEPVCYFGSPLGQMTVRSEWNNESSAAVFMKLGERTTSNHEHADAGTFQIFYNGLYTGDSGSYDKYGSNHWGYYHTQTIAHNGLLVANPALVGTNPASPASYFYSGGQKKPGEANNLEVWSGSQYNTGTVTGAAWNYNKDATTDYAYLGGDISAAYDTATASFVGRHMLTLYTGNPDVPMYFVVYDKITSIGENYKKTFLLHTRNEPVIDAENKTVTLIQDGGRLVLKSLLGADDITAVGGAGRTFEINGNQCETTSKNEGAEWGRVEISPNTGSFTNYLLNFIYVTDSDSEATVSPEYFTAENLHGLSVDDQVIVFANAEAENNMSELKFTTEGKGLKRYLILGMFEGTWNVTLDGMSIAHAAASKSGGMISFYAPAGDIVISPGKDIAPENGGRIIYNTFGGIIPPDSPLTYEIGVPVPLPTEVTNGLDRFDGWYTTSAYEKGTKISELIASEKGKVNLYAKYIGVAINEDYETSSFSENKKTINGVSYNGKDGSVFKTVKDEKTGNSYLHVTKGEKDPQIDVGKLPSAYLYGDKRVTLVIDLARDGSAPLNSTCRIRGKNGSSDTIPYFSTSGGKVLLGASIPVFALTEEFQTLAVTIDFENNKLTGYDKDGNIVGSMDIKPPAAGGCSTNLEWLATLTTSVNWWIASGETLLIDNFSVYAGGYKDTASATPEGYSKIKYRLDGGSFPGAYPSAYKEGEVTALPSPERSNAKFAGWFSDPEKTKPLKEISAEQKGEITVYASWQIVMFDFNAQEHDVDYKGKEDGSLGGTTAGPLSFQTKGENSFLKTETDKNGDKYLIWSKGSGDPQINFGGSLAATSGSNRVVSFTLRFAKNGGSSFVSFQARMRTPNSYEGQRRELPLFKLTADGTLFLSNLGTAEAKVGQFDTDFKTLGVVLDFEKAMYYGYNEAGEKVAEAAMIIPAPIASAEEMYNAVTSDIMNIYAGGSAQTSLRIKEIKLETGNIFENKH